MGLPVKTTPSDVIQVAIFLKNKPTGASSREISSTCSSKLADGRKLSSYQYWGLITKDGEKFRLTNLGRELVRPDSDSSDVFVRVLRNSSVYFASLEWIFHQHFDSVSNSELAAHWFEHHSDAVGSDNDTSIKMMAVTLFHVCEAAGLGTFKSGRRGQETRLELSKEALKSFIEGSSPGSPMIAELGHDSDSGEDEQDVAEVQSNGDVLPSSSKENSSQEGTNGIRVFLGHGKNLKIVSELQQLMALAEAEIVVAVEVDSTSIPIPTKVMDQMRDCNAGVLAVTVEDERTDSNGNYLLNENVLIEIGASLALYYPRIVLLWDKRLNVPSNLQGLERCEFEGEQLDLQTGMKLVRIVKGITEEDRQVS